MADGQPIAPTLPSDPLSSPYNRDFHGLWPKTSSGRIPQFVKPGWAAPIEAPTLQPRQFPHFNEQAAALSQMSDGSSTGGDL